MMLRIRNVLNIVFMILAVVGAVVYIKVDLETEVGLLVQQ